MRPSVRLAVAFLLVSVVVAFGGVAAAALPAGGTFVDDDGNTHEGAIEAIVAAEITLGCDAAAQRYCPTDPVTRGQMASFLARAFTLAPATADYFTDDDGTTHEDSINRVAEAGITLGVGGGRFDPGGLVTREQMASFLVRALELAPLPGDRFDDVSGVHEPNVNALAEAEITMGCDEAGTRFCPADPVRRDQMASFLARALGLAPIAVPPRDPTDEQPDDAADDLPDEQFDDPPDDAADDLPDDALVDGCPQAGLWTGTTSDDRPISFRVVSQGTECVVNQPTLTADGGGVCGTHDASYPGAYRIIDGSFSSGGAYKIDGVFESLTSGSGTFEVMWVVPFTSFGPDGMPRPDFRTCVGSGTWQASPSS